MKHEITISRRSVRMILKALSYNGWTNDPKLLYAGCEIFNLDSFDTGDPNPEWSAEEIDKWLDDLIDIELSEKQIDAVKASINYLLDSKKLGADKYIGEILVNFGIIEC